MAAEPVLDREFLALRGKILEVGATLDRLGRAGVSEADPRVQKLRRALEMLLRADNHRAEQIQLLFSRPYNERWREELRVS